MRKIIKLNSHNMNLMRTKDKQKEGGGLIGYFNRI
ncbi:hypothetical protein T259_2004 [Clostridium botulinum CDC_1436]|nr:hypothetical protein T259_2004 [Clostridium botulinum CDC_1436]